MLTEELVYRSIALPQRKDPTFMEVSRLNLLQHSFCSVSNSTGAMLFLLDGRDRIFRALRDASMVPSIFHLMLHFAFPQVLSNLFTNSLTQS